jgi:hypothetical protein
MKTLYNILWITAGFLLIVNVILTSLLLMKPTVECQCSAKKSLPCESVPVRWAVDNYDCANSLLLSMNVTNVKFSPKNSTNALLEQAIARLKDRSYSD